MSWTHFYDMHSGGGSKEDWQHIYIEAPEEQAKIIFYNRFGHNPERVSCTCCGEDYAIHTDESLEELTKYYRRKGTLGNRNKGDITLEQYLLDDDCLFIYNKDIKDDERLGEVPVEGYVWI